MPVRDEDEADLAQLLRVAPDPVRRPLELPLAEPGRDRAHVVGVARDPLERAQVLGDVALEAHQQIRLARPVILDRDRPDVLAVLAQIPVALRAEFEFVPELQVAVLGRGDRDVADVVLPHPAADELLDVGEVMPEAELRALLRVVLELGLLLLGRRRRRLRGAACGRPSCAAAGAAAASTATATSEAKRNMRVVIYPDYGASSRPDGRRMRPSSECRHAGICTYAGPSPNGSRPGSSATAPTATRSQESTRGWTRSSESSSRASASASSAASSPRPSATASSTARSARSRSTRSAVMRASIRRAVVA